MNLNLKLRQSALSELMTEHREWYDERLRFYKRRGQDAATRKNNARRDLVEEFNDELQVKMGNIPKSDLLYAKFLGRVTGSMSLFELSDLAAKLAAQTLRYSYYREYKEAYRKYRVREGYRSSKGSVVSREYAIMDVKLNHLDEYRNLVEELTADFFARQQYLAQREEEHG